MVQGFRLVDGQLLAIQQVKDLIDDGIRRFREEAGFRERRVLGGHRTLPGFWPGDSSFAIPEWPQEGHAW